MHRILFIAATSTLLLASCKQKTSDAVKPVVVTEKVLHDSDDPAIWINPKDATEVLIIGTDKGGDTDEGGLYTFDLQGKIVGKVFPLKRPNNVDVAYLITKTDTISVAVCTERNTSSIRVFSLPGLEAIDNGGIPVFENETDRDPMGIALYTNLADSVVYAIVGRKTGPSGSYLWQYKLTVDSAGKIGGTVVRKFGNYSGVKEIESIAADNELGFVYYADEGVGIHKYYAHPDSSNTELALLGTEGFTADIEGISIYKRNDGTGYLLVSDQQANSFHVFTREGDGIDPHTHKRLKIIPLSTTESDGSEVTSNSLPGFPHGLFVAMADDGTFQIYRWEDLAGSDLKTDR